MAEKVKIKAECTSCNGTGVYHGFAEPPGVGVICLDCNGSGCREIQYTPFTNRKRRDGIDRVMVTRGRFICGPIGPTGKSVSYDDFLNGKMPT